MKIFSLALAVLIVLLPACALSDAFDDNKAGTILKLYVHKASIQAAETPEQKAMAITALVRDVIGSDQFDDIVPSPDALLVASLYVMDHPEHAQYEDLLARVLTYLATMDDDEGPES